MRPDPLPDGLVHLDAYLVRHGLASGVLVLFDERACSQPSAERRQGEPDDRTDGLTPDERDRDAPWDLVGAAGLDDEEKCVTLRKILLLHARGQTVGGWTPLPTFRGMSG